MHQVCYQDWGLIDYQSAWLRQTELHTAIVQSKRMEQVQPTDGYFIVCEHPPVYTLGKSGKETHLLLDAAQRIELGLDFYKINRGGDITHHGPGQLVGYPILDLELWYRDVHRYVRNVEQVIMNLLEYYGIKGERSQGYTGVWMKSEDGMMKKVCAIGVHLSRWVSMHGFALNVNNDLSLFNHIIPCGIAEADRSVTSISEETGQSIDMKELKSRLQSTFAEVFESKMIYEYER